MHYSNIQISQVKPQKWKNEYNLVNKIAQSALTILYIEILGRDPCEVEVTDSWLLSWDSPDKDGKVDQVRTKIIWKSVWEKLRKRSGDSMVLTSESQYFSSDSEADSDTW